MTCIKSRCCFLDCSSFLLSASSRCFCSCISSIFHFLHFFDVLLFLLFHSLPHLSFVFSVFLQGSLELCFSFPLLWHYRLSSYHFALFLQQQLSFCAISSSAFSTSLKSVSIPLAFSSCRIFALNLSLKSVYRSLTDRFVTLNWGCSIQGCSDCSLSYPNWPLAMLPFFALNGSRTRIS